MITQEIENRLIDAYNSETEQDPKVIVKIHNSQQDMVLDYFQIVKMNIIKNMLE